MNKSTKQILIDARQSIIDNGLTNGTLVTYKEGTTSPCFCALGHIAYAAGFPLKQDDEDVLFYPMGYNGQNIWELDGVYQQLDEVEAVQILADEINPTHNTRPTEVIYEFNDNQTFCTIIAAFDKAITAAPDA